MIRTRKDKKTFTIGILPLVTLVIFAVVGTCFLYWLSLRVVHTSLILGRINDAIAYNQKNANARPYWTDEQHDKEIALRAEIAEMTESTDSIISFLASNTKGSGITWTRLLSEFIIGTSWIYLIIISFVVVISILRLLWGLLTLLWNFLILFWEFLKWIRTDGLRLILDNLGGILRFLIRQLFQKEFLYRWQDHNASVGRIFVSATRRFRASKNNALVSIGKFICLSILFIALNIINFAFFALLYVFGLVGLLLVIILAMVIASFLCFFEFLDKRHSKKVEVRKY